MERVQDVKSDVSECGWCGDKIDVKAYFGQLYEGGKK